MGESLGLGRPSFIMYSLNGSCEHRLQAPRRLSPSASFGGPAFRLYSIAQAAVRPFCNLFITKAIAVWCPAAHGHNCHPVTAGVLPGLQIQRVLYFGDIVIDF